MSYSRLCLAVVLLAVTMQFRVTAYPADAVADTSDSDTTLPFDWLIPGVVTDTSGNPVEGATIETVAPLGMRHSTRSSSSGKFALRFRSATSHGPALLIQDAEKKRKSYVASQQLKHSRKRLLRITLQPTRDVTVTVIDGNGDPIEHSKVTVLATYRAIDSAETDANGKATFQTPADARIDWIIAHHDAHGFDYYENYSSWPTSERLPVPEGVTLKLAGRRSVDVTVQGTDGQPISGVNIVPWTIKKTGKQSYANLSGIASFGMSDESGVARIPWMPADLQGQVAFLARHPKYHSPKNPLFAVTEGRTKPEKLTATLLRVATVRGTVRHADGRPAGGIHLQGEGRGATSRYFRGHTLTRPDGTYELDIYPDQTTILAVTEDAWAAKSFTDVRLNEGDEQNDLDFVLVPGTMITGRLTLGKDKLPSAGNTATLIQQGNATANLVRWAESDEKGRYRFCVGPGSYQLMLPGQPRGKPIRIDVNEQQEIVHDSHMDRKERGLLQGRIVDSTGKPVGGNAIFGESINARGHAGFSARSDAEGRFETERWNDDMLLLVHNADRNLATTLRIGPNTSTIDVTLDEAATVEGTLVGSDGQPIPAGAGMLAVSAGEGDARCWFVLPLTVTAGGRFILPGIPAGSTCHIQVQVGNRFIPSNESFDVEKADTTQPGLRLTFNTGQRNRLKP